MDKIIYIFIALLIISGCQKSENKKENLTIYTINAKLDTLTLSLDCNMKANWYNNTDTLVYSIPFTFWLDSSQSLIKNISIKHKEIDFRYTSKKGNGYEGFILNLTEPIKPFDNTLIEINFKTRKAKYFRDKILFFSEDMPIIQFYDQGKFNPFYQVHSDYNVTITYPNNFSIASSGIIEKSDTTNKSIKIKTSAKTIPSYGFILFKDIQLKEDYSEGVLIRSFYFDDDVKWGEKLLEYSKNIIKFYNDTLGFYPQPILTIIPGYSKPYGGWPICPNIVGIHRGIDSKKEKAESHAHWIMAHEIGHQYWGFNYILDPINYPQWFGIGMGIYTDRLYSIKNNIDINYSEYFSSSYFKGISKGNNTTIMQNVDSLNLQGFDWNNIIKHDKSYSVLRMLAYEIGEETFYKIFIHCLKNYKGINVTLDMFKKDCEKISKTDLSEFFHTWFYTNDYLEYKIESVNVTKRDSKYENKIIIKRIGEAKISHVEFVIILESGDKIQKQFDGNKFNTQLTIITSKPIKEIIMDTDLKLLLVNKKNWTP